jgi:hypothetical protein
VDNRSVLSGEEKRMTLKDFKETLKDQQPPKVAVLLKALWYDANGDWEKAHHLAQDVNTPDGSWVHAYLHRKEDDPFNAQYWYNRADRKMPDYALEKEWAEIAEDLINKETLPRS